MFYLFAIAEMKLIVSVFLHNGRINSCASFSGTYLFIKGLLGNIDIATIFYRRLKVQIPKRVDSYKYTNKLTE